MAFATGSSVVVAESLSHIQLFCDPMDYSLPGSSVHGISQARILGRFAISFSRESFWPRNRSASPTLAGGFFTTGVKKGSHQGSPWKWWMFGYPLSFSYGYYSPYGSLRTWIIFFFQRIADIFGRTDTWGKYLGLKYNKNSFCGISTWGNRRVPPQKRVYCVKTIWEILSGTLVIREETSHFPGKGRHHQECGESRRR